MVDWLPGERIGLARPPRNQEELEELLGREYDLAVSLLTDEDEPGVFESIDDLHRALSQKSKKLVRLPVPSGRPPSVEEGMALLHMIDETLKKGGRVLIMCGRAWGRSACLAAGYLVLRGWSAEEALRLVEQEALKRGEKPPGEEQKPFPHMVERALRKQGACT